MATQTKNVAVDQFEKACQHHGIEYRLHEASYLALKQNLLKETRFADLLLLSQASFRYNYNELINNEYTKQSLHYAECPVLIVPAHPVPVKHVILTYDGSASSVYAIKQFAALFPQLTKLDTLLVYVSTDREEDLPDKGYIEELAARHFSNLTLQHLYIDPKKHLSAWLRDKHDSLLVAGAKGRSGMSEFLSKSFIGDALQDLQLPLFLAHR